MQNLFKLLSTLNQAPLHNKHPKIIAIKDKFTPEAQGCTSDKAHEISIANAFVKFLRPGIQEKIDVNGIFNQRLVSEEDLIASINTWSENKTNEEIATLFVIAHSAIATLTTHQKRVINEGRTEDDQTQNSIKQFEHRILFISKIRSELLRILGTQLNKNGLLELSSFIPKLQTPKESNYEKGALKLIYLHMLLPQVTRDTAYLSDADAWEMYAYFAKKEVDEATFDNVCRGLENPLALMTSIMVMRFAGREFETIAHEQLNSGERVLTQLRHRFGRQYVGSSDLFKPGGKDGKNNILKDLSDFVTADGSHLDRIVELGPIRTYVELELAKFTDFSKQINALPLPIRLALANIGFEVEQQLIRKAHNEGKVKDGVIVDDIQQKINATVVGQYILRALPGLIRDLGFSSDIVTFDSRYLRKIINSMATGAIEMDPRIKEFIDALRFPHIDSKSYQHIRVTHPQFSALSDWLYARSRSTHHVVPTLIRNEREYIDQLIWTLHRTRDELATLRAMYQESPFPGSRFGAKYNGFNRLLEGCKTTDEADYMKTFELIRFHIASKPEDKLPRQINFAEGAAADGSDRAGDGALTKSLSAPQLFREASQLKVEKDRNAMLKQVHRHAKSEGTFAVNHLLFDAFVNSKRPLFEGDKLSPFDGQSPSVQRLQILMAFATAMKSVVEAKELMNKLIKVDDARLFPAEETNPALARHIDHAFLTLLHVIHHPKVSPEVKEHALISLTTLIEQSSRAEESTSLREYKRDLAIEIMRRLIRVKLPINIRNSITHSEKRDVFNRLLSARESERDSLLDALVETPDQRKNLAYIAKTLLIGLLEKNKIDALLAIMNTSDLNLQQKLDHMKHVIMTLAPEDREVFKLAIHMFLLCRRDFALENPTGHAFMVHCNSFGTCMVGLTSSAFDIKRVPRGDLSEQDHSLLAKNGDVPYNQLRVFLLTYGEQLFNLPDTFKVSHKDFVFLVGFGGTTEEQKRKALEGKEDLQLVECSAAAATEAGDQEKAVLDKFKKGLSGIVLLEAEHDPQFHERDVVSYDIPFIYHSRQGQEKHKSLTVHVCKNAFLPDKSTPRAPKTLVFFPKYKGGVAEGGYKRVSDATCHLTTGAYQGDVVIIVLKDNKHQDKFQRSIQFQKDMFDINKDMVPNVVFTGKMERHISIQEHCGRPINEDVIENPLRYAAQLTTYKQQLEENRVLHGDLKPSNLFYDKGKETVVIGDWDDAQELSAEEIAPLETLRTLNDMKPYISGDKNGFSPEIFATLHGAAVNLIDDKRDDDSPVHVFNPFMQQGYNFAVAILTLYGIDYPKTPSIPEFSRLVSEGKVGEAKAALAKFESDIKAHIAEVRRLLKDAFDLPSNGASPAHTVGKVEDAIMQEFINAAMLPVLDVATLYFASPNASLFALREGRKGTIPTEAFHMEIGSTLEGPFVVTSPFGDVQFQHIYRESDDTFIVDSLRSKREPSAKVTSKELAELSFGIIPYTFIPDHPKEETFASGKLDENKQFNRYRNILPIEASKVPIEFKEKTGEINTYTNANFVHPVRGREQITMQGALKNTVIHQLSLFDRHNIRVIQMVTDYVEKGKNKAHPFFPKDVGELVGYEPYIMGNVAQVTNAGVRYSLLLQQDSTGTKRLMLHKYGPWEDHGATNVEHILSLNDRDQEKKALQLFKNTLNNGVKLTDGYVTIVIKKQEMDTLLEDLEEQITTACVVTHCSAGVGRTGTLVLSDRIHEMVDIKKEEEVSLSDFDLKRMRQDLLAELRGFTDSKYGRAFSVQTEGQYQLVLDVAKRVRDYPKLGVYEGGEYSIIHAAAAGSTTSDAVTTTLKLAPTPAPRRRQHTAGAEAAAAAPSNGETARRTAPKPAPRQRQVPKPANGGHVSDVDVNREAGNANPESRRGPVVILDGDNNGSLV